MEGSKFDDQWGSILLNGQWKVFSFMTNEETSFNSKQIATKKFIPYVLVSFPS